MWLSNLAARSAKERMKPIHVKLSMTIHNNDPQLGDLEEAAGELGENDFWGIEPDIRDSSQINGQRLAEIVSDHGLHIPALATGRGFAVDGLSLSDPEPAKRRRAIDLLHRHIDLAGQLETNVIVGLLRGIRVESDPLEACLSRLADSLKVCGSYAAQKGCKIFFEAINQQETNIANTAAQAASLIAAAASPGLQLLLDTHHLDQEENSIADILEEHVSILGHFHLADRNRAVPGTAGIDFAKIVSTLLALGYEGTMTVEIPLKPDMPACVRQVRKHLNRMGIYSA